jgi:hypothetical protein
MITTEQTQSEILSEAAREAAGAAPVIKSLLESAAFALQRGNMAEAHKLLAPTITSLNFISQIMSTFEAGLGEKLATMQLNGESIIDIQARWVASLEELKNSISANDMVRTADLLAYEVSAEFDSQVAILQLLAEGHS